MKNIFGEAGDIYESQSNAYAARLKASGLEDRHESLSCKATR
jgi:hypothetical protein